jgi:hypothetical protein
MIENAYQHISQKTGFEGETLNFDSFLFHSFKQNDYTLIRGNYVRPLKINNIGFDESLKRLESKLSIYRRRKNWEYKYGWNSTRPLIYAFGECLRRFALTGGQINPTDEQILVESLTELNQLSNIKEFERRSMIRELL